MGKEGFLGSTQLLICTKATRLIADPILVGSKPMELLTFFMCTGSRLAKAEPLQSKLRCGYRKKSREL